MGVRSGAVWVLAVLCLGLALLYVFPVSWGESAIADNGVVSYLTIALIFFTLFLLLRHAHTGRLPASPAVIYVLAYVLLVYALREADVHRLFTTEHVTKLKFYQRPDISLTTKLLWGVPFGIFIVCFFTLIGCFARVCLRAACKGHWAAIAVIVWGGLLFVSQLVDKSDLNAIHSGRMLEEMLEFCAAGFLLMAVFSLLKKPSSESIRP